MCVTQSNVILFIVSISDREKIITQALDHVFIILSILGLEVRVQVVAERLLVKREVLKFCGILDQNVDKIEKLEGDKF
jgi:hypothetical protein